MNHVDCFDDFLLLDGGDNLFPNDLNLFVDRYLHILDHFNLHHTLLDDWHIHLFNNFNDLLYLYDSIHYFLNNLWHLHNFLHYSWYYNNLLYNFLYFHHLWHLYQFFNNFINWNTHFLDFLNNFGYFNYSFNYDFNRLFNCNILHDWFLNFHNFCHFNNLLYDLFNFNNLCSFVSFRDDFFHDLFDSHDLLLHDWHFDTAFHSFYNLVDEGHHFFNNSLHLLHSILVDNLLLNHLHLLYCRDLNSSFNNLFHDPRNFLDLFDCLDNWNNFFHDSFNNLRNVLHIVDYLPCRFIIHCIDQFLYDFLNLNDDRFLNNTLNDLLDDLFDFLDAFFHFLHYNSLVLDHLYFLDFRNRVVYNFLHDNWDFLLNDLLFNHLYFHDLWYLYSPFNNLFDDFRHFNNLLFNLLHLNNLFHNPVHVFDNFHWHMDYLFHLFYLCIFHNFLDNLLHRDNSGDFNNSLHHFFYYFRNLNNALIHLEYLEDIIN